MKSVIIYNSKYGATCQYANWLGTELDIPVLTSNEVTDEQLDQTDFLIIGTPVYYGKFRIRNWLKRNAKKLRECKIFFFVVSGTPPEKIKDHYLLDNIPEEINEQFEVFFFRGRIKHNQLSWSDRFALWFAGSLTKDPEEKRRMKKGFDGVRKEYLAGLIDLVNDYRSKSQLISQPIDGKILEG